jgi:hypothetical protein
MMAAGLCVAQSLVPRIDESHAPAIVRSVRVVPDPDGVAVEIVTTRPLNPNITLLDNPQRLVIDLTKAVLPAAKVINFRNEEVTGVRVNQFQNDPPITRVVVDLRKPIGYSWDAAGNRLMIRLRSEHPAGAPPTGGPTRLLPASSTGSSVSSLGSTPGGGSSISAGAEMAVLHLNRGGEVHVCPGTTVSVTYSQSGQDLMLGMSTGALETDYTLGPAADSVLTPDFRILMAGPGSFRYAISADSRGNTCVRALPGNDASVIVSELMGSGTYQVKSTEQVLFHSGRLLSVSATVPPDCGCPSTGVPVLRSAVAAGSEPGGTAPAAAPQVGVADPGIPALPPVQKGQVQIEVDAPFVFRASDAPPPMPMKEVAGLAMSYALPPEPLEVTVLPPPLMSHRHGLFGKVKGFFSGIFR